MAGRVHRGGGGRRLGGSGRRSRLRGVEPVHHRRCCDDHDQRPHDEEHAPGAAGSQVAVAGCVPPLDDHPSADDHESCPGKDDEDKDGCHACHRTARFARSCRFCRLLTEKSRASRPQFLCHPICPELACGSSESSGRLRLTGAARNSCETTQDRVGCEGTRRCDPRRGPMPGGCGPQAGRR